MIRSSGGYICLSIYQGTIGKMQSDGDVHQLQKSLRKVYMSRESVMLIEPIGTFRAKNQTKP